ncbi:Nitroreductase [gamma proteobacterium HdN1]|nr:Nitroreductase [gamma proteobacterium HdN1]
MTSHQAILDDKKSRPKVARRAPPAPGSDFNEVETIIMQRRSTRLYRKKVVEEHLVKRILESGRYAPSAGNCQSWKFVVVQDRKLIDEMADHVVRMADLASRFTNPAYPGALIPRAVSRIMMKVMTQLFHPTGITGLGQVARRELGVWHGASTVIFLLVDERGSGDPHLDVGIAGTNMVLTAHSFGLSTCWVSFASLLAVHPKYRRMLGIAYPYKLATSIAIGYPKGIPDGFVERETHETVWYGNDGNKTVHK